MEGRRERGGRGKKRGMYIYKIYRWPPPVSRCCFFEKTRAAFMCSCILYMHLSVYAHIHIQAHSLMRALTLSCVRTRARTRMHMHTTHTGARAQTRMHPGIGDHSSSSYWFSNKQHYLSCTLAHVGPTTHAHTHPRMNTHACARTRADTPAHAHMRTHPRYAHVRRHMKACARSMYMHAYARGTCAHAPAQCTCIYTYAHAQTRLYMRTHSCKHTPTYFGCALTDWGHAPQL